MLSVLLSALAIRGFFGNPAPDVPQSKQVAGDADLATDEAVFVASNTSFFGSRQLSASLGCQSCCGGGQCSTAYKGVEAGTCCLTDPKRPYCCPARAQCAQVVGHCLRKTVVHQSTHRTRVGHYNRVQRHDSYFQTLALLALIVAIIGMVLMCYHCAKAQPAAKPVVLGGHAGVGPGGAPVVYGQPVVGQPVGGGYCNGVGGNAALYGGTGFLGGLALGSMMGPGWGWGGWGGGYGYGPEVTTTDSSMTDIRSEEFAGDGGDFGGFGGDFGGFDVGGDFGGFDGDF